MRPAMARLSRVAASCGLLALAASAVFAQQPANVPRGRIAIINVARFQNDIAELKRRITEINTRFEPRTKELLAIRDTMQRIETQVQQRTVAPGQAGALQERYDGLKREYERKVEDMKVEAQKAYSASATPIEEKVRVALEKYANEKGIVLVMETGGSKKIGSIIYIAPGVDITDDFIAIYNKANP